MAVEWVVANHWDWTDGLDYFSTFELKSSTSFLVLAP